MSLPEIVDHETWYAHSKALLEEEKELTRRADALAAKRRRLPMVRIDQDYRFEGPGGETTLGELFGEHRQLIIQHFMFDPDWEEGCGSCSAMAESAATPRDPRAAGGARHRLRRRVSGTDGAARGVPAGQEAWEEPSGRAGVIYGNENGILVREEGKPPARG